MTKDEQIELLNKSANMAEELASSIRRLMNVYINEFGTSEDSKTRFMEIYALYSTFCAVDRATGQAAYKESYMAWLLRYHATKLKGESK